METEMTRRAPPGQKTSVAFVCIVPLGVVFVGKPVSDVTPNAKAPPVIRKSRRPVTLLPLCLRCFRFLFSPEFTLFSSLPQPMPSEFIQSVQRSHFVGFGERWIVENHVL